MISPSRFNPCTAIAAETCAWWLVGEPHIAWDPADKDVISLLYWLRRLYRAWLLQQKPCS